MRRGSNPQYFLQVENRRRNVFVTQLGQDRKEEGEDVSPIPVVNEVSVGEIMQHNKKALHRFQLLKKREECDQMTVELNAKKQEFKEKLELLTKRSGELNQKGQKFRAHALGFEFYLQECEKKKQRYVEKFKTERKLNLIKRHEIIKLKEEIKKLQARKQKLQKKIAKYKNIANFLQKVVNILPSSEYAYLGYQEDSVVRALIERHLTLVTENRNLLNHLCVLQYELEELQHEFAVLQEEQNIHKYMLISKVSELQSKSSMLHGKNITLTLCANSAEDKFTHQSKLLTSMLMAISELAEQCYLRTYGPFKEMTLHSKLNMIQEFILEKKRMKEELMPLIRRGKSSITLLKEQCQRRISIQKQPSFLMEGDMA
ncbi:uncharacterized protein CCDC197 isoform X1 [Anolis carolinensis]|uniref:uncharacterized protein CCDC197 isoform X1 n=2 Tax=Anolis carolinensis TaxID=28377 RepID=UPI002F2B7B42